MHTETISSLLSARNAILAHLLCPKLQILAKTDSTVDEFYVHTSDPSNRFAAVLSLGRCGECPFEETDRVLLLGLRKEFGKTDLYSRILSTTRESPTLPDIISRRGCSGDDPIWRRSDIEFTAEHFDEMAETLFSQLSFELAQEILSNEKLKLASADALYDRLSSRFEEGEHFYCC
jgi:hypothetical protein